MPDRPSIDVSALGPAAAAVKLWRGPSSRLLTVVVKVALELVPEATAKLVPGAVIALKDRHYHESPGRSLEEASDVAPYLSRCDVTVRGTAHAPPGQPATSSIVRLLVYRGAPVLEKQLFIVGDRATGAAESAYFQRMPLDYEHAYGGKDVAENPVGRSADGPRGRAPNVVDPVDARKVAGFAPLSRFWAQRARLLGATPRQAADGDEPALGADFDFRYYQAAPADQQVPYLAGDEWIVLDGMHPALPRLSSQLPALRGAARLLSASAPPRDLALELDTLSIDADRRLAFAVFRASAPLPPDAIDLRVIGAVSTFGAPIAWPEAPAEEEEHLGSTRMLTPDAEQRAALAKADPFSRSQKVVLPPSAPVEESADFGNTRVASPDDVERGRRTALPFESAPRAKTPPPPPLLQEKEPETFAATVKHSPDDASRAAGAPALPFAAAAPGAPSPAALPAWRPPRPSEQELGETVTLKGEDAARAALLKAPFPLALPKPIASAKEAAAWSSTVPRRESPQVPIVNSTPLAVVVTPWQLRPPTDVLTLIVKGTFDLVAGARATIRGEAELPTGDLHADDDPGRPLLYGSDFAVVKPRADVVLTGHAHARGAGKARAAFRFGDEAPHGFSRTVELEDGAALTALGPIPPLARERWSKLGTFDSAWLESRWPYFPADFDPGYFQGAPRAQQLEHLRGDEPFEIGGMHPDHARLTGSLPGARPRAFSLRGEDGELFEIPLRLDTAAFDADEMKVNLVWRGLIEVSDDEAPELEVFFVHLEALADEPAPIAVIRGLLVAATASDAPELPPAPAAIAIDPAEAAAVRAAVLEGLESGASFEGAFFPGGDLTDLDLRDRSFANATLKDARLRGARLAGVDLRGAVLAGADLTGADLTGANLAGADLVGAKLDDAKLDGADLAGADLSLVEATRASFEKAHGAGCQFAKGVFVNARFDGASLAGADFSRAELDGASFTGASMPEVRLYYAKAEGARFDGARLDGGRCDDARLVKCSFKNLRAESSVWEKTVLEGSSFAGARLAGSSFARAAAEGTSFEGADLREGRFQRAKLGRAHLGKANLAEADLERADLAGADLRGASLHAAETWKAKLAGALLEGAILTGTKLKAR